MPLGIGGSYAYSPTKSMFWNPGSFAHDMGGTSWGNQMLEKSPQTAFYRYARQIGAPIEGNTPFAKWFQDQYSNYLQGYNAYTVSNPLDATISGYTKSLGGLADWQRQFQQLAPSQRGVNLAGMGAGPARWIG